jgi:hypothetical protein
MASQPYERGQFSDGNRVYSSGLQHPPVQQHHDYREQSQQFASQPSQATSSSFKIKRETSRPQYTAATNDQHDSEGGNDTDNAGSYKIGSHQNLERSQNIQWRDMPADIKREIPLERSLPSRTSVNTFEGVKIKIEGDEQAKRGLSPPHQNVSSRQKDKSERRSNREIRTSQPDDQLALVPFRH